MSSAHMIGMKFGWLEVTSEAPRPAYVSSSKHYWRCFCHGCGATKDVRSDNLRSNKVRSCGCKSTLLSTLARHSKVTEVDLVSLPPDSPGAPRLQAPAPEA